MCEYYLNYGIGGVWSPYDEENQPVPETCEDLESYGIDCTGCFEEDQSVATDRRSGEENRVGGVVWYGYGCQVLRWNRQVHIVRIKDGSHHWSGAAFLRHAATLHLVWRLAAIGDHSDVVVVVFRRMTRRA